MYFNYFKSCVLSKMTKFLFSGLSIYSSSYIFIKNKINFLYCSNKVVKYVTDFNYHILCFILTSLFNYKIEPFYESWLSYIYINDSNVLSEKYYDISEYAIFSKDRNALIFHAEKDKTYKSDLIQLYNNEKAWYRQFADLPEKSNKENDFMAIIKINNKYICRKSFLSLIVYEAHFIHNTCKYLLCIEYEHPKMKEKIFINLDPKFFLEKNEILSPAFVKRCLLFQRTPFIFDLDYKLNILDNMMKTFTIDANSYIYINRDGYEIKKM